MTIQSKYRSRKFLTALGSFVMVSMLSAYAMIFHVVDATGAALVIGAWTASDALILKLYNDANIADGK